MQDQNLDRIIEDIDETTGPTWMTQKGAIEFLEALETKIAIRIINLKKGAVDVNPIV